MNYSVKHIISMGAFALGSIFPVVGKKHQTGISETFIVSTTADSGKGSLRQAINCVNARSGNSLSAIEFNIPTSQSSVCDGKTCYVIQPGIATNGLPLPVIQNPVKIKGPNSDGVIIRLDGQFATQTVIPEVGVPTGLALVGSASGSTIKNLTFVHFGTSNFLNNVENVSISYNSFSADVINQSSIFGISISNLDTKRNTFTTTTTDTNGIFLTNPTGKIAVKKSSFDGFSDAASLTNGNGVYVLLNNGGTLDTLDVSCSSFSNFSNPAFQNGGVGVFMDFEGNGGALNNYIVNGNAFANFNTGSLGVLAFINAPGSVVNTFSASCCIFNNIRDNSGGILMLPVASNATIDNVIVSHCTFNTTLNQSFATEIFNVGGTVNSASFTNCTFNNTSNRCGDVEIVNIGGTVITATVTNCAFNGISNPPTRSASGIVLWCMAGSVITNAIISGNTFNNITGRSYGLNFDTSSGGLNVITNLAFIHNTFNGISSGGSGIGSSVDGQTPGEFSNWSFTHNTFNDISDTGMGINAPLLLSSPLALSISDNTFTGNGATNIGYAANISVIDGSACLKFANNINAPLGGPAPYELDQFAPGVLNTTSDSTGNQGQIATTTGVVVPGSCALPLLSAKRSDMKTPKILTEQEIKEAGAWSRDFQRRAVLVKKMNEKL